jgi:TIR domain
MKLMLMGSLPTYDPSETRELTDQEAPFARACEELGYTAAARRHTVLIGSDQVWSADHHAVRGVLRYAGEGGDRSAEVWINRSEGAKRIYDALPANVKVVYKVHTDFDSLLHGGLIPNLAALDTADVLITVGGRLSVKLMGQIAADREKPILAVPSFGGTSVETYESLKWTYRGLLKDHFTDLSFLRSAWQEGSAARVLDLAESLARNCCGEPPHSYFLSYVWGNSSFADHVEVLLHRFKRAVNRDESMFGAGTDLSDVVRSLIDVSDTFIGLWDAKYEKSTWCPQELAYALKRAARGLKPRRVVLITLDDTEPPLQFFTKLRLDGRERGLRELAIRKLVEEEAIKDQ